MADTGLDKLRVKIVKLKRLDRTNFDNLTGNAVHYSTWDYKFLDDDLDFLNSQGLIPVNFSVIDTPEQNLPTRGSAERELNVANILGMIAGVYRYRIDNNFSEDIFVRRARIECIENDAFVVANMFQSGEELTNLDDVKAYDFKFDVDRDKDIRPTVYPFHPVHIIDFDLEFTNSTSGLWSASTKGGYLYQTGGDAVSYDKGELNQASGTKYWIPFDVTANIGSWSGALTESLYAESARNELTTQVSKMIDEDKATHIRKSDPEKKLNAVLHSFQFSVPKIALTDVVEMSQQDTIGDIYGAIVYEEGTTGIFTGSPSTLVATKPVVFGQVMSYKPLGENSIVFSCKRLVLEDNTQNCLITRV